MAILIINTGFMLAFLLSLVLVAVNIGQIITIIVPLINKNASPDHNFNEFDQERKVRSFFMKCGYGAETTAVSDISNIYYTSH